MVLNKGSQNNITRNLRYVKKTPIKTKQYLQDQLAENSGSTRINDNDEVNRNDRLFNPFTIGGCQ